MRLGTILAIVLLAGTAAAAPPKKKAASKASAVSGGAPAAVASPAALVVVETIEKPKTDYQAEVYSGVPLDDRYARERGVDKGLVLMVFDKQRRAAFRVPREKIKKRVRLATTAQAAPPVIVASLGASSRTAAANAAGDHVDVLDTDDGVVVVDTATTNAGIFTTSDVYVFPRGATFDRCMAMVASAPLAARERVRAALGALR
jgi:hypothetical protein